MDFKKIKYYIYFILAIMLVLGFTLSKTSPFFATILLIGVFIIAIISLFQITKEATKNVWTCVFWLLFIPIVTTASITGIFQTAFNDIAKSNEYILLLVAIVSYLVTWIAMAWFGDIETTKHAIFTLGSLFIILFLLLNMFIDFVPPKILETSKYFIGFNELKDAGYQIHDFANLIIKILTYPTLIASLVSYWTIKYRELKA